MRRGIKLVVAVALVAVCGFAATAYATRSAAPPNISVKFRGATPGSGKGLKIGYISLGESVPFVVLVSNSIKKQAKIAGAQLVFCDSALDAAKALNCVKSFKTQGVQGYLNFDLFANASAQICKAGPQVPVISIDIHQKPCEKAFMGANNASGSSRPPRASSTTSASAASRPASRASAARRTTSARSTTLTASTRRARSSPTS